MRSSQMSLHTGAARGFAPCLTPAKGFPPFANPRAAPEKDMKHYEVISLDIAIFGLDASDHYSMFDPQGVVDIAFKTDKANLI